MAENFADQRWKLPNSAENSEELRRDEEDDDEEALSLSDLPLIRRSNEEEEEEEITPLVDSATHDQDFDFCSFSKESEMCAADEVFFQGQILPLRHSISSEKGSLLYSSRSVSRSESMDHPYSGRLISSRSSSISSHQSSSSGSSSATAAGNHNHRHRLPPRNQFHSHSHPSPSPRLNFTTHNPRLNHRKSVSKSSVWNILRLGLVTAPPGMAVHDLKTRSSGGNFGSRHSTSSNGSSVSSSASKKKKGRGLLGGCKCSMDAVDTVPSRVVIIKRSASESEVELHETVGEITGEKIGAKQTAKKYLSHHRTFEWLKQLSVEATSDERT